MALFGAPIAHEDGPRRAGACGLGIQRALREYGQVLQAERDRCCADAHGHQHRPGVVGKIGDDLRMDYTAVGDTNNLAARLQQAARRGHGHQRGHAQAGGRLLRDPRPGEVAVKGRLRPGPSRSSGPRSPGSP